MVPMPKNLNAATAVEIKNFLSSFDTVLSDCDGVLWLMTEVIKNSQHTINKFIEKGKKVFYVTNNNSLTREEFADKCKGLGFVATKEDIVCTSYLAAEYLKNINFDKKVYLIGNQGLTKEFDKVGIKYTSIGPDPIDSTLQDYVKNKLSLESDVGAVVVGFDEHFSYPKILKGATYLSDPKCHFLVTCPDETFPVAENQTVVFPGTGALITCLEAASGRKAVVLGKPNDNIKNAIMRMHNLVPEKTLMIGDRCNTDILFGNKCGFKTLLVMTGVTSLSDVEKYSSSTDPDVNALVPQFYIDKLGDLLPHLSS